MYWVLQDEKFNENGWRELVATLERAEIPHSHHVVIPLVGVLKPDVNPDGNVIVFGSYAMRHAAREKGWTPGCFDLEAHTYAHHVEHWGAWMLNGDATYCRFDEVLESLPEGMDAFFIRPVIDSKYLVGEVTNRQKFGEWLPKVVALGDDAPFLSSATEVMFCPVKAILREYRLWIVDREVATASLYKQGDRVLYSSDVDPDIIAFGRERAAEWEPARAYVMDVALLEDGEKRIIETNAINSAGLYAANVPRLIEAIERMEF